MNLIKLEDLHILPLEEIRRVLHKIYDKMIIEDETHGIDGELDLGETETNLINNVVPMPEEFREPFRRNTHFLKPSTF